MMTGWSSDDGTCRIWDIRHAHANPRIYVPKPLEVVSGKSNGPSSSSGPQNHQILCCAYNANGTVFVTGSSDTFARVWNACKPNVDDPEQPNHEMDVLSGHENDVNYAQFSGCAVATRFSITDTSNEDNIPKFKNSWFTRDNIVTCSRDGSAIIWVPKSRRSHSKVGRWTRAYHLKVPPPPMPPQPLRGGPRQRLLPTPRGVNMIVWSLDNRFVLAAIMDCRICVWNAADGSLVHSLTGHSESTYVLDVHPFNPRIAMSAGYDGKTIVWDIWEGTPIRIYEIGRFKLVDGKFSPDGTSIILSDDVGQIYILNTGQGESQKDAKYDQFFLGDYRTLIQDTHGNVLDQETQLAPYWRNIQDLLCDSSMMPYPEPYQSMYQQRRLGALGIERRHSSVNFSVGSQDGNSIQDYQLLPLPDLDIMIEPLPEFIDAMDLEAENEYQSDDNDSEYNVTDEFLSEGEQGSRGTSSSSGDPVCSAEDSEAEQSLKDALRRSKRKNHKQEVEFMTSSGRRVKRRNLDECDGTSSRNINNIRKTRRKKKSLKRKQSESKSLRPQRVAARNARDMFSRLKGVSPDEDGGTSEDESSDGETVLSDSDIQSNESDRPVQNMQPKNPKGKEVSVNEVVKNPELQSSNRNRKRFVLKLPVRQKHLPVEGTIGQNVKRSDSGNSASEPLENFEVNGNHLSSQDPGSSSGGLVGTVLPQSPGKHLRNLREQSDQVQGILDLSTGYQNNKIRWGEVKARSSKRLRYGSAGSHAILDDHDGIEKYANGHHKPKSDHQETSPPLEIQNNGDETDGKAYNKKQQYRAGTSSCARIEEGSGPDDAHEAILPQRSPRGDHRKGRGESLLAGDSDLSRNPKDQSGPRECKGYDESLEVIDSDDQIPSASKCKSETDPSQEVGKIIPLMSTKLRIGPEKVPACSFEQKCLPEGEHMKNDECDFASHGSSDMKGNLVLEAPKENECNSISSLDQQDRNRLEKPESLCDNVSRLPTLEESKLREDANNRMYRAVYKRSKSYKAKAISENDGMEESASNGSNSYPEAAADGVRRTRSMALEATTPEPDCNTNIRRSRRSVKAPRTLEKFPVNTCEQFLSENWGSNSRVSVGLRSARNRRENYSVGNLAATNKRKLLQSTKKLSWLMLSEPEENHLYVPQLGDEVAYLRQGHEACIDLCRRSKEKGPWTKLEGLRAVEFCKVECLEYSTFTGSGESCCKITLGFVDPSSSVFGETFKLTLPELNEISDFLVEKTRYDASIERNWTKRDKCQVWWRNEDGEGGSWWDGRIVTVQPKSTEYFDSPWEKYAIQYKSDADQHLHSPWELRDMDTPWDHPHIDDEMRNGLLLSIAELELLGSKNKDRYGLQKLEQVSQKSDFLNRFPVPLTLEVIQSRLEHNYYRTLEAVKHDFTVMLENGLTYFSKNEELKTRLRRLSDWLHQKLLPLQS
ncbi:hypothetical protein IFM89_026238 [Coptis chinensis]|uniref:Bromo domain-containing protein n=1 Tax=Coptis chinensis TaxID=261450 RepID=A0A835LSI1_9MAGN|nr:hypothetical protein IFM89_026238 [Coptis chinensis]